MKKQVVLASMLALLSADAMAGVIRDDISDIAYRQLSYNQQFDSVGAILFDTAAGGYICSGTVVASNWVLTAGHCVDEAINMTFLLPQFNEERTTLLGHVAHTATDWTAHENWTGANLWSGWDIGLMYFDNPFNVTPANLYSGDSETGAVTTHVGYGATGNGLTGVTAGAGTRRAGQNVVDGLYSDAGTGQQILVSDFDHRDETALNTDFGMTHNDFVNYAYSVLGFGLTSDNGALDLEYGIAGGDSGGAAFIEQSGEWLLAGVHSFGSGLYRAPTSRYGEIYGSVRVSDHYDWIQSYTAMAVPNPATLALFGFGLTMLWARRRRR
ncbi:PEP-CTERM protein-sorting domain-containing protein [Arsukibacterium tuosuense]|uniref:PEP-CTERM protein-sorting domain-containing protein n=1 Tax=Arsukibacterium tuosuense TaxID=1323745 RepID=A0A285IWB1_9GAMM|nr:trypsin-like serine protease [Arsukibacterium tuosuense]SNY52272.1 PEP-CTERM protein-sorting domain-containing protein [Arsukibacterium tuosuense]